MAVVIARPSTEDRIRAALWFAERGFGVFSVWSTDTDGTCRCKLRGACEQPGKHPVPTNGLDAATTDPHRIRAMLATMAEPNWGMLPPDGVFALDVDGDGTAQLAELEAQYGPLPPTLRTNTAHGQHVFLRWPADLPRPVGAMFGYVTRWGSGARRGYVIGPRSVHSSGAVYTPADGSLEIAEMPEAWARAVIDPGKPEPDDVFEFTEGYQLPEAGYDGERYGAILRYVGSRYMRGISQEEVWVGVLGVLAPRFARPLTEPELRDRFDRAWKTTPAKFGAPMADPEAETAGAMAAPESRSDDWPSPPDPIVYHGPLGEVVRAVAEATEADPVGVLGMLLGSVSACFGHGRYLYQGSAQSTNLFVVLVGDTSSGRKGTAGSIARDVMDQAYPTWASLIVAGLGSGEGLISYLKKRETDGEHRALVMESEFGRLLTVMMREGSTLSPIIRDAWDGVPMGRVLADKQALVRYHHVGVIAHVTPVELRQKLNGTDAANGFGNRFLWLAVRRTRLVPFPESPVRRVHPEVLRDIGASIDEAQSPREMTWSSAAHDAWEDLYFELAARHGHGLLGAMTARTEAQIVRIALAYALLDRSPTVELEHLQAGRALWDFAERSIARFVGTSTGDRNADVLRAHLVDGPISWQDARTVAGLRTGADVSAAVDLLQSLGIAEVVRVKTGAGRPKRFIRAVGVTALTVQRVQGTPPEKEA